MTSKISRRTLLKTGLAAEATSIAAISCSSQKETSANKSRSKVLSKTGLYNQIDIV